MFLIVNLDSGLTLLAGWGAGRHVRGGTTMTVDANGLVIGSIAPDGYQPSGPEMQLLRGVCHDVGQELAVIQVLGGLVVRATAGLPDDVRRRLDEMTARASYVAQMMSDAVEG